MDPPLLLLDEPTAGLDPNGADDFVDLLRSLHRELGLTVVMVTHDLDTLFALSSRVAVLAEKRVLITGTAGEVVRFRHPFIEHFFLGARGRRAMTPLGDTTLQPDALNPDFKPGSPTNFQPAAGAHPGVPGDEKEKPVHGK
jgi:phospholipid/cholesterol/gamma-HCH transport system ATP-binding protein